MKKLNKIITYLIRDVSGVELLINDHRSIKAEIAAREESMSICINLGRTLLHRGRVSVDEVRAALINLITRKYNLEDIWEERWDYLQLILEVYQFARYFDLKLNEIFINYT